MNSLPIQRKLSLRNIGAHKLRLIMTVLAVVLGTSFVSGGFILTASLSKAFDDIITVSYEGSDLVMQSTPDHPLTQAMGDEISSLPGVEKVEVTDIQPIVIIGPDGEPYQSGGAGSWLLPFSVPEEVVTDSSTVITEGRAPERSGEAVINTGAVDRSEIGLGDVITVINAEQRTELEIVGLTELSTSTGGWAGVQVARDVYGAEFSDGTQAGRILIRGDVGKETLSAMYPGFDLATSAEAAARETEEASSALAFFTYIFGAFGLIALLVGTFIISNTFSMIVAQRTKEFALLRAVGMSRPQLTGSVLAEAVVIGTLGSALGIGVGIGLVRLIVTVMEAFGLGFPDSGLGLDTASILVPMTVGILVTVFSAWVPARRAGAVHPVQVMRSGDQASTQPVKVRSIIGTGLLVIGVAATSFAAFMTDWSTTDRAVLTGVGALALITGVVLVLAGLIRVIYTLRTPGRAIVPLLAGTNLARSPRRSAATAFALTLGVSLVAVVGILGASITLSVFGAIDEELRADTVVTSGLISSQGIPGQAIEDVAALDGVAAVVPGTMVPMSVGGKAGSPDGLSGLTLALTGDPTAAYVLDVVDGGFEDIATRQGVGVSESVARELDLVVGEVVEVTSPATENTAMVPVVVIWEDAAAFTPVAVTEATAQDLLPDRRAWSTQNLFVTFQEGVDPEVVHESVVDAINPYGVLQVMTKEQYRVTSAEQINQLLALVYALLALSVVIAVLGIINTLALSIMERRHEFGMLRAVGMQRSQIGRMVTIESVHIAVLGAVMGIVSGTWLGWCFVRTLSDQGINRWAIPWDQMALIPVAAVVVGVVAAIWPARKAAQTSPLRAVE
ncbi:ABC transporter permease [Corynebacterium comes]|uniref:ABC transporter permease YtrF n=1 Tax=Corynebacterium comes TaxID=2675218 RepID=A0A6B8VY73_9CORY|nr:ABC transporter permease [Corynebacterium comes]QGU03975.1 ABC transporter permease YtrF precursor [Corynebacterium comes]